MKKYLEKLKVTYRMLRLELRSYSCVFSGDLKAKFFFDKNNINKLEIGSGQHRKKGFITSDRKLSTDFPYDYRQGLPFPNESLDFIYSEHVLEHLDYRTLIVLLKDCYRTLKPNGRFSAAVPDTEKYLNAYFQENGFDSQRYCEHPCGFTYDSKINYLNYIFYMDGQHHYMFDRQNVLEILTEIGFKNARLRNFDPELDHAIREDESIYVEAVKH